MTILKNWERLTKYWKNRLNVLEIPCTGASEKDILKLEKITGAELPNIYKESIKLCNESYVLPKEEKVGYAWLHGSALLSINEIIEIIKEIKPIYEELDRYDSPYEINGKITEPINGWPDGWIPFLSDFGYFGVLDLRPDIGDEYGQVLLVDPINGFITFWAKNYEEFLTFIIDKLIDEGEISEEYYDEMLHHSFDDD